MTALMGKTWNYFTATASGGYVHLFPGKGNHTWGEVREYLAAFIKNNTTRLPLADRKSLEASWAKEDITGGTCRYSVITRDDGTRCMVVAYEYEETSDRREEAQRAYEHLPVKVIEALPADILTPVKVADADMDRMGEETIGRIEMRVGFLLEEACALRMTPAMYPAEGLTLLEKYNAIESTWDLVSDIALSSVVNEDVRLEARYLTYALGLLRFDLYRRSRTKGVEPAGDPALKWASRTGQKNW